MRLSGFKQNAANSRRMGDVLFQAVTKACALFYWCWFCHRLAVGVSAMPAIKSLRLGFFLMKAGIL